MSKRRLKQNLPQPKITDLTPVLVEGPRSEASPELVEGLIEGLIPQPPAHILAQLEEHQAKNLRWCEEWGKSMPQVEGIPVCQSLSYDLIQILNRAMVVSSG